MNNTPLLSQANTTLNFATYLAFSPLTLPPRTHLGYLMCTQYS